MISLLIALIVVLVVLWGVRALLAAFSVPDPWRTVVFVLMAIIGVLYVLRAVPLV